MTERKMLGLCALAIAGAVPAAAADAPARAKYDPDKIVCRVIEESGSRLRRHKICATMRRWAEDRREIQEAIDKIQNNRPSNG